MVKASIKTASGIAINLDGNPEEIMALVNKLEKNEVVKKEDIKQKKNNKLSIGDLLLELREEGFFNKPKSLVEIKNGLAEKGRIYSVNTLSTQVLRQVKKRNLGRIKEKNKWEYVKR